MSNIRFCSKAVKAHEFIGEKLRKKRPQADESDENLAPAPKRRKIQLNASDTRTGLTRSQLFQKNLNFTFFNFFQIEMTAFLKKILAKYQNFGE